MDLVQRLDHVIGQLDTGGGGLEYFQRDRLGVKEGDLQERKVKCGEIDGGPEGTRDPNMTHVYLPD